MRMAEQRIPALAIVIWCCAIWSLAFGRPAAAQVEWKYVSGLGSDAAPCSQQAPCRRIGHAVNQAPAGGVVVVLDSGVFPPFQIGKSISIVAAAGATPFIRVAAGIGITINTAPEDVVVLKGLFVQGVGGEDGVELMSGGDLHVESCEFGGFTRNGLAYRGEGKLYFKDSIARDNGFGVHVNSGSSSAYFERARFENNGDGLSVFSGLTTVRDSVMSGNDVGVGVGQGADLGLAEVNMDGCLVANNGDGVRSDPEIGQPSLVRIAGSTVTDNSNGLVQVGTGVLLSRGDNTVEGNGTDLVGTIGSYSAR